MIGFLKALKSIKDWKLLGLCVLFFVCVVQAEDAPADPQVFERSPAQAESGSKGEKKKALSFEDELVEGATQKPELFYLFQKKNFNYKRLIKLRENFLPEMRKTSENLQRVRSAN
jgi:hypothetical protein